MAQENRIPAVGLGNWKAGSKAANSFFTSIVEAGYRHIDTTAEYGIQEYVGQALQAAMKAGVNRKDLFVTSKIWWKAGAVQNIEMVLQNQERITLDMSAGE